MLEARQIAADILQDLFLVQLNTVFADDKSSRYLGGPGMVFNANDRCILNFGTSDEERLQLCGSHLESLVFDEVLEPANDVYVIVLPDADIASSIEAVQERVSSGFGLIVVTCMAMQVSEMVLVIYKTNLDAHLGTLWGLTLGLHPVDSVQRLLNSRR